MYSVVEYGNTNRKKKNEGFGMGISEKEYDRMSKQASPGSPVGMDCLKAFLIGGLICAIGEVIFQLVQGSLEEKTARLTVSVVLIAATVILTGLQVFDNIAKHAGAGTLVPITGFANSVVAPAIEFKAEGLVLGLGAKMFVIAGPVLVYGITASAVYGLILYLISWIG